jgi:glycerol uptake facilitator protein
MTSFLPEFIGTALLLLLGNGVNANVSLSKAYGNSSGWIVIAFGWAIAVFVGVYVCTSLGGSGHLNPAVTVADAIKTGDWSKAPVYIGVQMLGAMTGAFLAWLAYRSHFDETDDANAKLGVFCNAPAIPHTINNIITEVIGTFALVFGAFSMSGAKMKQVFRSVRWMHCRLHYWCLVLVFLWVALLVMQLIQHVTLVLVLCILFCQ